MLTRQKVVLALLHKTGRPLAPTVLVKLMFLLRHETEMEEAPSFYDFVPYKYGPFSFSLYRDLANLQRDGYVDHDEKSVGLCDRTIGQAEGKIAELPQRVLTAVDHAIARHSGKIQRDLVKEVYARYPWYASNSELSELKPKSGIGAEDARPAAHTAGYEGKSVDAFFDHLMRRGIRALIDVRANPLSHSYGFSKSQLSEIANKLGLSYFHRPRLGIPREYRIGLTDFDSYQRLLDRYEREMLPQVEAEIHEVGELMKQTPAALMCVEKDVRCCHRSRLAQAVSRATGLETVHL